MSKSAKQALLLRAVAEARAEAALIDLPVIRKRLEASGGGVDVAYTSAALEIRVEVLNSPGPGTLRAERGDVMCVALDGSGVLGVEDRGPITLEHGEATVVPVGVRHVLFGNPRLSLLVGCAPGWKGPTAPLALCRKA